MQEPNETIVTREQYEVLDKAFLIADTALEAISGIDLFSHKELKDAYADATRDEIFKHWYADVKAARDARVMIDCLFKAGIIN